MNDVDKNGGSVPVSRSELPRYAELPAAPLGGKSAWGLFGPDDSAGLLNLQTTSSVLACVGLVKRGVVFPLDAALDAVDPPLDADRGTPRHRLLHKPGPGLEDLDDVYDNFYPQISSQWDSLAHVAYSPGVFYNGATDQDVLSGGRNTIDHWARRGIVARAVLLDLQRSLASASGRYAPDGGAAFSVAELEAAENKPASLIRRAASSCSGRVSSAGTQASPGLLEPPWPETCARPASSTARTWRASVGQRRYGRGIRHLRRGGMAARSQPGCSALRLPAQDPHRAVPYGTRRVVVARQPGRRLRAGRCLRIHADQLAAEFDRRHRISASMPWLSK